MTTCRAVVTEALIKTGDLEQGERPGGPAEDRAMIKLQAMYEGWAHSGLLGACRDVLIDEDTDAEEWVRYTAALAVDVTLPASIADPLSPTGQRSPRDGAIIILALGEPQKLWRYNYPTGAWQALHELTLSSTAPMADFGLDGIAACLAVRLASDTQLSPATIDAAVSFKANLAGRWGTQRQGVEAEYL